jgi:hypothetical protein
MIAISNRNSNHMAMLARFYPAILLAACALAAPAPPRQLALALHESGPTAMTITWACEEPYSAASSGSVTWAPAGAAERARSAPASSVHTYNAGWGWNGTLFFAEMTGLVPGARYSYAVTSNGVASNASVFSAAPLPAPDATVKIGVLADMGTIELFGWTVAAAVIKEHTASPFDLIFIAGDLAYATVDPPKNELQRLWDLWGLQNEPFSSTAPFMMTVGVRIPFHLWSLLACGSATLFTYSPRAPSPPLCVL